MLDVRIFISDFRFLTAEFWIYTALPLSPLSYLPGALGHLVLHGDTPGGTLAAAQSASLAVLQISLVVPVIVQTNGTVRAEKIADTALDALILIPHRLLVAPVLIGSKIFCKGKFCHTHPILASVSVKRCKMSELNSTNKKKSQRIF
jgi:hypothetical protein